MRSSLFGWMLMAWPILTTAQTEAPLTDRLYHSVLWFHTSPEAVVMYEQCYDYATIKAQNNLKKSTDKRPKAVILDIDETVLSNAQFEVERIKEGIGYSSANWKAWTDRAAATALPGALRFTRWADSSLVAVFYISNRKVNELESTIKNLSAAGFPQVEKQHVLLRDGTENKDPRRESVAANYEVILLVGDNLTDFNSAFADRGSSLGVEGFNKYLPQLRERFIMLPNPMYGEWEKAIYGNTYALPDSLKKQMQARVLGID